MIIEINDMTTPMLSAIRTVSREVAFEQMSKIGNAVRQNARNRMSSQRNRHHWLQTSKNGVLIPYYNKAKTKELGLRTKPDGSVDNPDSMRNMISSFLMEKSGMVVVGGGNKAFTPVKRRDGEVIGVEKRQGAITKHTRSIIHKLDTGERNSDHGWGSGGHIKEPYFENAKFKGRHFMVKGFGDSIPYMKQELTAGYEKTVGRAVNKVKVRLKPSKRVIA